MSRRSERREARRLESLIKGIFALVCLFAFLVGGVQNFVPVLVVIIVGGASLAGGAFLGYRWYKNRKSVATPMATFSTFSSPTPSPWSSNAATPVMGQASAGTAPAARGAWSGLSIRESLGEIDWYQFEKFCAAVLRSEGYAVERKGGAQPDGGVDLIAAKDGHATLVQCKHWRTWTVQEKVVRELLGSMTHYKVSRGALYTLAGATKPAEAFAWQHGIEIVDGAALAARAKAGLSDVLLTSLLDSREHRCPKCEAPMVWRTGDFTPFWGCSTYPRCRAVLKHSGAR